MRMLQHDVLKFLRNPSRMLRLHGGQLPTASIRISITTMRGAEMNKLRVSPSSRERLAHPRDIATLSDVSLGDPMDLRRRGSTTACLMSVCPTFLNREGSSMCSRFRVVLNQIVRCQLEIRFAAKRPLPSICQYQYRTVRERCIAIPLSVSVAINVHSFT